MSSPRELCQDAAREILADNDYGFNPRFSALADAKGIAPMPVDFGPNSTSFCESAIAEDADNWDYSTMFPKPIGMALYTLSATNTKDQNASLFSGQVELRLDVYLQFSSRISAGVDRIEDGNTEVILNTIEHALMLCFHGPEANWGTVNYNFDWQSFRGKLRPTGDGWQQRISILLICGVHV